MKNAVRKLSARFDEMFAGLGANKQTAILGSIVMLYDTLLDFHSEGVITDEELKEAMEEVDIIYPQN